MENLDDLSTLPTTRSIHLEVYQCKSLCRARHRATQNFVLRRSRHGRSLAKMSHYAAHYADDAVVDIHSTAHLKEQGGNCQELSALLFVDRAACSSTVYARPIPRTIPRPGDAVVSSSFNDLDCPRQVAFRSTTQHGQIPTALLALQQSRRTVTPSTAPGGRCFASARGKGYCGNRPPSHLPNSLDGTGQQLLRRRRR